MYTADRLRWGLLLLPAILLAQHPGTPPPQTMDSVQRLASLRRLCVDKFVGEETLVGTVREIAIASVFSLKLFSVTEKCEKADAVLKGAVIERAERRVRAEGEATDFGVAAGGARTTGHSASAGLGAAIGGAGESLLSAETGARASVTLRIVDTDGDVLWAYTQDSPGGKNKGAVADAVERAVKQLQRELSRQTTK